MPEVRRLQKLGSTSLVVTLPHKWVRQKGLKVGDTIYLEETPEGLKIDTATPNYNPITCIIDADKVGSPSSLAKLVAACYLQGYDVVRIVSMNGLTSDHLSEIHSIVEELPGFEMMSQDANSVTVQSIIDPTKFRVEALIKRMQVLCASMLTASIDALLESMPEKVGEVASMEKKLDELYFLAVRQVLTVLRFPSLAKSLGIGSYTEASGYRLVAKVLEEIGDHALVISKEVFLLGEKGSLSKSANSRQLLSIIDNVVHIFGRAVNSFISVDFKLASEVFDELKKEMERIRQFEVMGLEKIKDSDAAVSVRVVLSRITDVLNGCKIISEVAINKFVKRPSEICSFENLS
ncbi:MAG: phosphate uptake regulator PhoU [Aigarchaeota archaeon]|nr:phosphate uptake regulator PhoU [Aigarchaeota archaeon]MDW8093147.1 phosphate uptake regulator PhoU [Nitrososphaerota archaeon]